MKKYLLLFLLLPTLVSCKTKEIYPVTNNPDQSTEKPLEESNPIDDSLLSSEIYDDTTAKDENLSDKNIFQKDNISAKLNAMTIEEKIGQLFIIAFRNKNTIVNDYIQSCIKDYNIGGVVLFSENIVDKDQVKDFIIEMKSLSSEKLIIAVDEEGGSVSRLKNLYTEKIPSAKTIGDTGNVDYAYRVGTEISNMLIELGFNANFAPVADILTSDKNLAKKNVLKDRSFSNNPEVVAQMITSVVGSFNDNNILSFIKHYPGIGDTTDDTHFDTAYSYKDIDQLLLKDLIPFKAGIDANCTGVMVSHVILPNTQSNMEPAIFSEYLIDDVLETQLGFEGIVITDALDMSAVTKHFKADVAALKAFNAGVDILLMPEDFILAYNGLLNAYNDGVISLEDIDNSVYKILQAKENIN